MKYFLLPLTILATIHASADLCDPKQGHLPADVKATTTVYYTPTMTNETVQCASGTYNTIIDHKGRPVRECSRILAILNEQGSGTVRNRSGEYEASYIFTGRNRFKKTTSRQCPMGYGNRSDICQNPCRTIAAHMGSGYKQGDTIFVPRTAGMKYPLYPSQPKSEWATHDGYWVIGDTGGAIKGRGRFDFFTGAMDWRDKNNPMMALGFGSGKNVPFCRVSEARAERVRRAVGFPGLSNEIQVALLTNTNPAPEVIRTAEIQRPATLEPAPTPAVNMESLTPSGFNDNNVWFETVEI